jgi:hypothetical protein
VHIQELERRMLLSINLTNGVLAVVGTDNDDLLLITTIDATHLRADDGSTTQDFLLVDVTKI